ncbi:gliding motility-associated ABC transporter substrate-binding protein GldG [Leeuwenhoekiella marinoflava]|uniref:Protein involved in gliding motility GldG n=2 Tax=Leeuwenhoekiella marinoflava TaxID=988 RepID=A0A4V1KSP7_9FLAO|nr:gliding motility-associated ABC transporter substrate-binding protein GldG [Leeuwenhoekiella marinoflava]RXG32478.1 protein involved in gliding motility GldG [Leeuwenhoekiella marinoflava]SHE70239.1 gliding-associated putative ABC transporter substrate-binding component GldG [Leeuwenhoekiella marinoflava DSM 3653]
MKQNTKYLLSLVIIVGILIISKMAHFRIDLTTDGRYTLSETSENIIAKATDAVIVDVFLEENVPDAFLKLQIETRQLLEEYASANSNIKFAFVNPVPEGAVVEQIAEDFNNRGMRPEQVQLRNNGKVSQEFIFPWAIASYKGQTVRVPLLKKTLGASPDELVSRSVQNLEYAFSEAFYKLLNPKSKRIAVLKGNGEMQDKYIADFLKTLRESYYIAPFPLDSISAKPDTVMAALNKFNLIVAAKPTEAFTDLEKYALDQYTMQGGKSLYLIDQVAMETDSLYLNNGRALATARSLNLDDFFFKYGIRINPVLVEDLYAAPLVLASGEGNNSQYSQLPWFFYPLVSPEENHPISTNIDNPVFFKYANQIDLLDTPVEKTVLLQSSVLSKLNGVPLPISLESITTEPSPENYSSGNQNLAVLLEGQFTSAFINRILPIENSQIPFRESAIRKTAMIVVADGDLIKNDLDQNGRPLELGFDKFTFKEYGNKEFLLNAVNYLLDDSGLINIRSKSIVLPALDIQKTTNDRYTWQALTLGLPLVMLLIFSFVYTYLRKRRYNS